ncbi:SRR1-like protein isoform X1 [Octopus bimaculoides]|uniref:SRR1-like domain-containing protein n=1 Tax=Octopus bimaculoides TaxID=37653 RepID=A0A0L8H976_OCTBM|nr:SRR1-like protein isoform X1 [Octopus bimaculoides]|eukprot:XP_014774415.1 PREDICTED: SRR1-like protein isoform X1 [Octopus bimaculoides]
MTDDFQLVVRPKRRQKFRKAKQFKDGIISFGSSLAPECQESKQSILHKLQKCRNEIELSDFYTKFQEILVKKISECLLSCHYEQLMTATDCGVSNETFGEISPEHSTSLEETFKHLLSLQDDTPKDESSSQVKMEECITQLAPLKLELVAYGIGHFAECKIAQYQLALMMAICDQFKLSLHQCYTYDPVWSDVEKSVIHSIGVSLLSKNEEGKRSCLSNKLTLFLMPHCGTALYNNLLWANWNPSQLRNLIIVGNSFQNLVDRHSHKDLREKAAYIYKIYPATEEISLSNTFVYSDIFNDTSIHCFPMKNLKKLPEDFWLNRSEPNYNLSDIEIIVNK